MRKNGLPLCLYLAFDKVKDAFMLSYQMATNQLSLR